jgi:hypothetical protein
MVRSTGEKQKSFDKIFILVNKIIDQIKTDAKMWAMASHGRFIINVT